MGTTTDPFTVENDQTTVLKFGPPYRPVLKVLKEDDTAYLSISLWGIDNETVDDITVNGREPAQPTFTITDPKGKIVAEGRFEYG